MRLVPGMLVKYKVHTAKVIFYLDEISVWFQDMDDKSVFMAAAPDVWIPTGEVDWSLVPDGTEIEFELWDTPKYTQGIKIGSRDNEVFIMYKDTRQWIKKVDARIQQPEPDSKPAIDFEANPPKPGDEYLSRNGETQTFVGMGFRKEDRWVFENVSNNACHYFSNGIFIRGKEGRWDIVSRKPSEPIKHKEKFWVQIYPLRTNEVYLRVWDITDKNKFKPDEDCLACKEIEIEWTEGEGL